MKTYTVSAECDNYRYTFSLQVFCCASDGYWYLSWHDIRDNVVDAGAHRGQIALLSDHICTPLYMLQDEESLEQCKQLLASDPFVALLLSELSDYCGCVVCCETINRAVECTSIVV